MIGTDIVVKCVALGLVLMVADVQTEGFVVIPNHPNCPDPEGPVPVYFVHPTNCSKFYECRQKDAYEFDCPPGLHFNSRLNVCDHPLAAQCESSGPVTTETPPQTTSTEVPTGPTQTPTSEPNTSTETPLTTTSTSAPQPTTTTPSPTTTTTLPTTQSTTTLETTVFPTTTNPTTSSTTTNPTTTSTTTNPTTSSTTTNPTTSSTTTNPTTSSTPSPTTTQVPVNPPTDPHCPPAGASWPNYWAHPSDCTKYLACWEGCMQQFTCPDGRYWNDGLKACDQSNLHCTCPVIPPAPNTISPTTPIYV